jgi:hypothetical protein
MKNNRRWTLPLDTAMWMSVSLAGIAILSGCATKPAELKPTTTGWVKNQVADSYTFGFPLVATDIARERASGGAGQPGQAPLNAFRHASALPPVGANGTPSVDTLDSTAWLDVSADPVIVSLPAAPRGRYLDARAFDAWTNALYSSADTTPYPKMQLIAFVPAGWTGTLPANATRVETRTRYVWLSVRVRVNGPRDVREARKLQTAMRIDTLTPAKGSVSDTTPAVAGAWPASGAKQPPVPPLPSALVSATPGAQAEALDANAFFARLARSLDDNPAAADDSHAMSQLADLGVKPGEPVQFKRTDAPLLDSGLADARERLATVPPNAITKNGWTWFADGVGIYGTDYTLRAYLARRQIATSTKEGEVKPVTRVDDEGHALNGANQYTLHFPPNQLPPVRGFWTITAYTKDGALTDATKLPRLSISDRDRFRRNRDGSVDVIVSAKAPGRGKDANWLPAPEGEFQLAMRLYAPRPQAIDGSWAPPPVQRQ